MDSLQKILDTHESWLTDRIILYAKQFGYAEDASALYEAWRLSVAGLSASPAEAIPALVSRGDDHLDSLMEVAVREAQQHHARGMRLGTFLGLFKRYRQAYGELFELVAFDPSTREAYRSALHECFDRAEIAFCNAWIPVAIEARCQEPEHANAKLRHVAQEWKRTFDEVPYLIAVVDAQDRVLKLNRAMEQWLGTTTEAALGKDWPTHALEKGLPLGITSGLTANGKPRSLDATEHGEYGMLEVTMSPFLGNDAQPAGIVYVARDISRRKKAEIALRESEQKLDGIVGSMTDHLIMLDSDHTIIWANAVAQGLFGSDLVGRKCHSALCQRDTECQACAIHDCMAGEKPHDQEQTLTGADGEAVHFWGTTNVATRHDDGRPKTFVRILRDVTELKRTQELLLETEGLRAVSELTAGVAHNFRNLLQVIMSAARLASIEMKDGDLKEADLALEQILRTSYFGAGTIKRIEEFAKSPADLPLKPNEVFDLSNTVSQAIEMSKPFWKSQPQRQGITIHLERELEDGAWVKGQEGQLFEVMVNLLRNAVESLRGDGKILVRTRKKAPAVFLTVTDSGSGIAAHNLRKVFEPFWTTKVGRGSGMGLATTRRIVTSHQGSISVDSAPGSGSTFSIRLPLAANPHENKEMAPRGRDESNLSILVIDDVDQSAKFLSKALERSGHSVMSALSGEQGLGYCEDRSFDVVLCDLCMPEMDGLAVARRIKDACLERGVRKPAFVLVTGWMDRELSRDEMEECGVDGLLEKPADLDQIHALVKETVKKKRQDHTRVP